MEVKFPFVYPDSSGLQISPANIFSLNEKIVALEAQNLNNSKMIVIKSSTALLIRTRYDSTRDLVQVVAPYYTIAWSNNPVDWGLHYLVPIETANTVSAIVSAGIAIHNCVESAAPMNYNSTYIGGNHGASIAIAITANDHGKTYEDVGSEWLDGSARKYYIVRIVDANNIWVLSENIGTSGTKWQFDISISGNTLTHSSHATHTGTITIGFKVEGIQFKPAIKNKSIKVYLDGVTEILPEEAENTVHACEFLSIIEYYEVCNPVSSLAYLIAHVGSATELPVNMGDAQTTIGNHYIYTPDNALVMYHNFVAKQDLNTVFFGFMQLSPLGDNYTYPKMFFYIPNTNPIGGVDYSILTYAPPTGFAGVNVNLGDWEFPTTNPPDRIILFLANAQDVLQVGCACGYVPTKGGISINKKDLVTNAMLFYSTRKFYPHGIDNGKLATLSANVYYEAVTFKRYFNPANTDKGNATAMYHFVVGNDVFVFADYHSAFSFDRLMLPEDYVGKNITVVSKHSTVTVHSTVVSVEGIYVTTTGKGSLVLKLT